jgi:predicted peptidase
VNGILETFVEEEFGIARYRISRPEGYDIADSSRSYPLVVYLHGSAGRGSDNQKQLDGLGYLGYGIRSLSGRFQTEHPSFVYVPQSPLNSPWRGEVLEEIVETIEHLKTVYPIDPRRLYLIGFSLGGSGSYELANRYYQEKGQSFAAIVRMAGQLSYSETVYDVVAKSAVWLHVGLQDTPLRVDMAREAFKKFKERHADSVETMHTIVVDGYQGNTSVLKVGEVDLARFSVYPDLGHGISYLPAVYPDVLTWMFSKEIDAI